MAVYATEERINFLDLNRVHGNIFNLIDIATRYISEHMNWRVEFDGKSTSRIEIPEVPVDAIREIVVNAFAHANYRSATEHQIEITPSMIDIYNPGEFPVNYNPEDFAERRISSMPRNRKILDILFRSKNVEIQGSGLRKVIGLCASNNVKYTYYKNEYGFRFSFYRNNLINSVTNSVKVHFNETDRKVLKLLMKHPVQTRDEIAHSTGKTVRTIQRVIDKLRDSGKITRVGSKCNGYWKVLDFRI